MKSHKLMLSALLMCASASVFAGNDRGHGKDPAISISPRSDAKSSSNANAKSYSDAVGVGVGIGQGGKANADSVSMSEGGRATANGGNALAAGGAGGQGGTANAVAEGGLGGSATSQQSQSAQGGNATNAGNAQTLSVSSSYEEKLQAPSVFAPAVYASGSCAYGWSAGISIPGGGISGGRAKPDPSCDRREIARVLTPLNPQLALKVLCADPIVKDIATESDCTYATAPVVSADPAPAPDLSKYATKDDLERAFKKSVAK